MRPLLLALPLLLANAKDPTIPAPIMAMLEAAMKQGDEGGVNTIVKYARAAAPESADAVVAIAGKWQAERREKAERKLRSSKFLALVKGHAELGGYYTTGNTNNIGATAQVALRREGYRWRHKLRLQADYQESLGVTNREHYLAAYEPNFKIDDRAYVYGAAQYESDRFLGYYDRFSVSTGAGYSAIKRPGLSLDLELGPAFRNTRFTDGSLEHNFAARGSLDLDWKLSKGISLHQDASAYVQDANSTVSTKSAVSARLIGPLSAQLSYTVQYESQPPSGRRTTDTTSRAALVIDF
ncbi:MAG: DUF481 domain-containing protein [Pseudomonadota bacterium]